MSRKFAITIKGVRASNLPKKDVFTKCDSYLIFSWPGREPRQTAVAYKDYNPKWPGFEMQLTHTLHAAEGAELSIEETTQMLAGQFLTVECFAKHSLRKDSLIGVATVSLLLLTAGPVRHKLQLRTDRGPLEGTIELLADVRCQSVTSVALSGISCHLTGKSWGNYSLRCQLQSNLEEVMTPVCFNTRTPAWNRVEPFYIDGDLVSLLGELVKLRVVLHRNGEEHTEALCEVRLQKYNTARENYPLAFREVLVSADDNETMGLIEGKLVYQNLPLPCQMQGGSHDTGSIIGAAPMLRDSVMFKDMVLELIPSVIAPYEDAVLVNDEYAVPLPDARREEMRALLQEVKASTTALDTDKALEKLTAALAGDPVSRKALVEVEGLEALVGMLQQCAGLDPIGADQREGGDQLEGGAAGQPACDCIGTLVSSVIAAVTDEPLLVETICTKETVLAVTNLLEVAENDDDCAAVCQLLLLLAEKDSHTQGMVANSGAIPNIVSLLLHSQDEHVQYLCTTALGALVFGVKQGDAGVTAMIRNLGGLGRLLAGMRSGNEQLRKASAKTVRSMAENNEGAAQDILGIVLLSIGELKGLSAAERGDTLSLLADISLATYKDPLTGAEKVGLEPPAIAEEQMQALVTLLTQEVEADLQQRLASLFYLLARREENKAALLEKVRIEEFGKHQNTTTGLTLLRRSSQLFPESSLLDHNLPYLMVLFEAEDPLYRQQAQAVLLDSMGASEESLALIIPRLFSALSTSNAVARQGLLNTLLQSLTVHGALVPWQQLFDDSSNGFFAAQAVSQLANIAFISDVTVGDHSAAAKEESEEELCLSEERALAGGKGEEIIAVLALNCLTALLGLPELRQQVLAVVKGCLSSSSPLVLERAFALLKKAVREDDSEEVIVAVMELTDSLPTLAGSHLWAQSYESNLAALFSTLAARHEGLADRLLLQLQPLLRDGNERTESLALRVFEGLYCGDRDRAAAGAEAEAEAEANSGIESTVAGEFLSRFLERAIRSPDFGGAALQPLVKRKPSAVAAKLAPLLKRRLEESADNGDVEGIVAAVRALVSAADSAAATEFLAGLLPLFAADPSDSSAAPSPSALDALLPLVADLLQESASWQVLLPATSAVALALGAHHQADLLDMWYSALFRRIPANDAAPALASAAAAVPAAAPGGGGAVVPGGAAAGQQEQMAREKEAERVAEGHARRMLELVGASTLLSLLARKEEAQVVAKARELLTMVTNNVREFTDNILRQANDCSVFIDALHEGHRQLQAGEASGYADCSLVDIRSVLRVMTRIRSANVTGLLLHHSALPLTLAFLDYVSPDEDLLRMLKCSAIAAAAALLASNSDQLYEMPLAAINMPQIVQFFDKSASGVTAGCQLLKALFFDARRHQQFLECDGFFLLGRSISSLSSQLLNSSDARQAVEQAAHFLVGAAQVSSLRLDIVGDGLIPIMLGLLSVTRVEEILLPVLGFVYFISTEPLARMEMIDTREVDTLMVLMEQRKTFPKLALAAEECFVRLGGITTLCTIQTSSLMEYQEYYICKTCGLPEGVCARCAMVCHKGHTLSAVRTGSILCKCGTSPHCLIKARPNLRVQVPLRICSFCFTGKNYAEQIWYYCRTCYRNEQKGVCATCASVCHSGHDVRFGSESRFYCDCSDRYGMMCRCREQPQCPPGSIPRKRKPRDDQMLLTTGPTLVDQKAGEEEQDEAEETDDTCIVCMDQPKDALFYKCGHVAACMECACMLKQRKDPCIICREPIQEVIRIYKV